MTEKRQKIQKLKTELLGLLGELDSDEDDVKEEETLKPTETIIAKEEPVVIEKKKREMTEKQKEALKKGQEKRLENAKLRREQAELIAEHKKKEFEDKLVKKALSVKKKQIKEQALLNTLSDDEDLPIEKVKKIIKETKEETKKAKEEIKGATIPKVVYKFF